MVVMCFMLLFTHVYKFNYQFPELQVLFFFLKLLIHLQVCSMFRETIFKLLPLQHLPQQVAWASSQP